MFTLIARCIIIYTVVLIVFRLMGKRQLGELQPFEFVITLIVADLATLPMADTSIPLIHGIVPLITLLLIHFVISFLMRKSIWFRKLVSGKPIIIISPNGIDYENLKKLNLNLNDIQESLRNLNYFNFDDIEYAIVETNGKITAIPKAKITPATKEDLNINCSENRLFMIIVSDGKIVKENMVLAKIDENFILKQIKRAGENKIKDILVFTLDNDGNMYIQAKNKPYKILKTTLEGGNN
ncbi:MAG: DUF421 domain-containing protein [Clostridiales bacterium]|nr:DUF421 domain-containing protein [Clostridiales bacterium]